MIRTAVMGAYQYPETQPRDVLQPCRPSCCRTPFFCARKRQCGCHKAEVRS